MATVPLPYDPSAIYDLLPEINDISAHLFSNSDYGYPTKPVDLSFTPGQSDNDCAIGHDNLLGLSFS